MKTIIFVMPRLPFPTTSGRKTSLFYYCKILNEKLGYRVVVAAFLESNDNPDLKPDFIDKLVVLPKVTAKEKLTNIVAESFLSGKKPMQVGLFWSKNAKTIIDELIQQERPDIVIADMVRTTEYLKDVNCYKIADLDDMISLRYERQLYADPEGINPYGAYLTFMPKFMQKVLLNKKIKLLVVKYEVKLLKKYEIEMSKIFDNIIFVAESEAERLNKMAGSNKAIAVPIGVNIDYFSESIDLLESPETYIGFLGAMSVAHNENAAINFIENILPLINKELPNVKFVVVGGGISDKLKNYANDNIIFTGRVDDVRKYIKNCKVFVSPLIFGSGIKTKNLEAMAMGVPVVTTSIGGENIHAEDGKDWIVADDNKEFSKAVITLILDETLHNKIAKNGFEFVKHNFTWDISAEKFKLCFHELK